jgi:hypothetical protein
MKNRESIIYMDLGEFMSLRDFLSPVYITPEILEKLIMEYPDKPLWHRPEPDFIIPSIQDIPEDYKGMTVCLSCMRVYEITPQRPACIFPHRKEERGPYCTPCSISIARKKLSQ